mmetsp:Transcript_19562/g.45549  ORF Transcript_19562/g.45549 Transcript_19562/m.45549 type:complete len:88 (+) Transcript_19562:56-319(+)
MKDTRKIATQIVTWEYQHSAPHNRAPQAPLVPGRKAAEKIPSLRVRRVATQHRENHMQFLPTQNPAQVQQALARSWLFAEWSVVDCI